MKILKIGSHKRVVVVVCLVFAVAAGFVWYWNSYLRASNKGTAKELRQAATKQEKMRLSDADANKQNQFDKALTEIGTLNKQQKFADAKVKIDKLAKDNSTAPEATRDTIYGLYAETCTGLVDIQCMNNTLKYFESKDTAYFIYAVQFAEAAKAANKPTDAKAYYQYALTVVDKNGGQKFIDNINKVTKERQYDYGSLKASAS